ncbi:hypothetical protein GQ44DRAFT_740542 [Phaeosphaeriaceae sp. PMI808]|nr:hypothetical protein GQ44DRAFT_740542 [Phaeosphaeriaceae sp. PMI808]
MPRFTARNVVVALNILLLTALFVHLKYELLDKHDPTADLNGLSHLPDELFDNDNHPLPATVPVSVPVLVPASAPTPSHDRRRRTAVVVASQASENVTWLDKYFPQWEKNIYHVDDPNSRLTVPKNKGRESMVYLTYIIEHYDELPHNVLFIHPNRYQWHNDDPDYDGLPMLRHFQIPHLETQGYVNIRCAWSLGCPNEIKPLEEEGEHREAVHAGGDYKQAFQHLFPGQDVPRAVGVSCCAQFAATRETIRKRTKSEYIRYRSWIMETDLGDGISGRIFEYSWHMIFGKPAVHCPSAKDCYCNVFGLCNLTCNDKGSCEGRYTLPPSASLPTGWPFIGWKGEQRERAALEE